MTNHTTPPIVSAPGRALIASSIFARLPLAMFSIALLVHTQQLTGSFAAAGVVSGAYAISGAVSAPVLGRLVDRCGQTTVLVSGATLTALALVITGLLPAGTPPAVLVALAAAAGMATPPLGACMRTLLPGIVGDPARLPALFAFESTALEITFVLGPPLALGLGAVWSMGAALASAGLLMLVSTLVFATRPASRDWRPDLTVERPRGGSLRSPAILILALIELGAGTVFGATEVGITAAAKALGSTAAAGPVLGIWGVGSLLGGIAATRFGGGARRSAGLILLLVGLAVAHGTLIFATGSVLALAAVILLAGATIAPTAASIYAMVDRFAPAGTATEAFSWALTAAYTGEAVGAAVGGGLVQSAGATAAFAFVGAAGAVTVLVAILGRRHLDAGAAEPATISLPGTPPRSAPRTT
ncbi:MAG TPA: MFS transporter [Solirubrobacteraceae bacterium]|nr:MFS transporter [Solirubrobacteraceae bacterium]